MSYRRLDFSKLNISETPITMEEVLKDITPLEIPEDVISGKRKMTISNAKPIKNSAKVGISISYV